MQHPIKTYLETLHGELQKISDGKLADYIPELTKACPDSLGICMVTMDGEVYGAGDTDTLFTIQSISKPFVFGAALADRGDDLVGQRVGVEPSGDAFNSISLNPATGTPRNPMINAGAIATTSLVAGATAAEQWSRILQVLSDFAGRALPVDEAVYLSESSTGFRNRAIAWMLKNFNVIDGDPMAALENYFRQCSVQVHCQDLAFMAATLANGGVHPQTGQRALPADHVQRVLSVMATCGMYDYAGSWLYEIGMPAKSGVAGGVIAVLQGRLGVAVYSPPLDSKGNSVRGIEACRRISRDFNLHAFSQNSQPSQALVRVYSGADAPSRRRPGAHLRRLLMEEASRIKYLCLQGYLAVDGAEYIIRRMAAMTVTTHSFILDMHQVEGISDSAARLLNQTRLELMREGIALVFSRIQGRQSIAGPLSRAARGNDRGYLSFEDNDLAVEWCENRLAESLSPAMPPEETPATESVLLRGQEAELQQRLNAICQTRHYSAGEQILRAGDAGDGRVFVIESGQVSVLVPLQGGAHQRIASLGAGLSFGEMALLGAQQRSATVVADTDVRCREFTVTDFEALAAASPRIKIVLLENLSRDLADKLRGATQWIAALA